MKSNCQVFLVFDVETGGLKAETDAILEIAFCPMDNELNDLKEFESGIIKPKIRSHKRRCFESKWNNKRPNSKGRK